MTDFNPPATILLDCTACNAAVNADCISAYQYFDEKHITAFRFYFCRCPACSEPMVAVAENWLNTKGEGAWDTPGRYLPRPDRISHTYPKGIGAAFGEALSCFRAKAYTATAVMCRKTLEGICSQHGVSERTLAASLAKLRTQGLIDTRLFEWADTLRISGNEAAHGVEATFTREDAQDIVEFTRALLEYVFTFADKFEAFKKRRGKLGQGPGTT